jgi:2-phospho-L-lactate guanylyltransferase
MDVLVPFDAVDPKSRLGPELDVRERREFAEAMLADVLDALAGTDAEPVVLATGALDCSVPVPVDVDERPLSEAVNARLAARDGAPLAVVMADLALATPEALAALFERRGDVVLAPGRGGGTNALVVRHPEFRVDYHGASVHDHREVARRVDADLGEVDSFRLATDVDEATDLVEVLLHSRDRAHDWLVEAGYRVVAGDGRVGVRRR